jgi:glycosyltransferase involved in cell wall biosynthesis
MIIYFGNMLSKHGYSATSIETIGGWLSEIYPIVRCSDKRNPMVRLLHMLWVFCKNLYKTRLILIDTYSTTAFIYAYVISLGARLFKIDYIPILHGGDLPKLFTKFPKLGRGFIDSASDVITPSLYLKAFLVENGWKNPIYIPNGIELNDYRFSGKLRANRKILWVRSFHQTYNPKMAIEVLSIVKKEFPDVELCMVGPDKDGSMTDVKQLAKSLGVISSLSLPGKLSKKEWTEMSKDYSIFINTTNIDNAPVSVVEAMALGLVVISTNVGGIPYLLKDGSDSILVEPNNSFSMANWIINLNNDPVLYSELAKKAREKSTNYDWSIVKDKWKDVFAKYSFSL